MKNVVLIFFLLVTGCCAGQSIQSYTFVNGKQLTPSDSIRLKVYIGANSSLPFYDYFNKSNDTLYVNFRNCEEMLAFYGFSMHHCSLPPQPAGVYKVKIVLRSVQTAVDPTCTTPYSTSAVFDSLQISALFTGLTANKEALPNVTIYPNPTTGFFKIDLESTEQTVLDIYNNLGRQVYHNEALTPVLEIDLSPLPSGIYFLKTENKYGQRIFKVAKD